MDWQEILPLDETAFHNILNLATGSKHAYSSFKGVAGLGDGRNHLRTKSLDRTTVRFPMQESIARLEDVREEINGRYRKYHSLTCLGQRVLVAEMERLQSHIAAAQMRTLGEEA